MLNRVFSLVCIEPPKPITRFLYECGKSFILDPLVELYKTPSKTYGVIEIYGEETYISKTNDLYELHRLAEKTTKLQKRQGRGGQSQNRIARLRLETIHNYLQLAAEKAIRYFVTNGVPNITGLLVLGHGLKKEQILEYIKLDVHTVIRTKSKDDPILPYIIDFVATFVASDEKEELQYIDHVLQTQPNLLVFGDELEQPLKKLYNSKAVVQKYGGPVGELFYVKHPIETEIDPVAYSSGD